MLPVPGLGDWPGPYAWLHEHVPGYEPGHSAVWMDPGKAVELLGNDGDASFLHGAMQWLR